MELNNSSFIKQQEDNYIIDFKITADPSDIKIEVIDNEIIKLSYDIVYEQDEMDFTSTQAYSFYLPKDADTSSIRANLDDEDLSIVIGKLEPYVRVIPITIV